MSVQFPSVDPSRGSPHVLKMDGSMPQDNLVISNKDQQSQSTQNQVNLKSKL